MIVSEIVSTSSDCGGGSTGTVNGGGIHCWKQHDVGFKRVLQTNMSMAKFISINTPLTDTKTYW